MRNIASCRKWGVTRMAWEINNEKRYWNDLLKEYGNEYGVAGLMGNLKAESGLIPFRKQGDMGYPDYTASRNYTNGVDNGTISESTFVNDSIGYGLAQWTYYNRKQNLYNLAKRYGMSIGSYDLSLTMLITELREFYPSVESAIRNGTSIREVSDIVLTQFEKPADQSEEVKRTRAALGQAIYDNNHGTTPPKPVVAEDDSDFWLYVIRAAAERR